MPSKRLPLSCENCRQRKIRCLGSGVPCDTCLRRGFASSCHFKREFPLPRPDASQEELLRRISALEKLLRQNIEMTASLGQQQMHSLPSPISDGSRPSQSGLSTSSPASDHNNHHNHHHHLGTLITSSFGHVRYVPFNTSPDSALLDLIQEPVHSTNLPFFSEPTDSHSLLDSLPPMRQCDELQSVFFAVFSPLFHILHDPTFHAKYAAFKASPSSTPLSFLALIFVTLALAVTALDDAHPLLTDLGREATPAANIHHLAARYRSAAMRCLAADSFLWHHDLHTVQALVLLIYALNHAHGPAWALLGTAVNIAVAIGCHVDPAALPVSAVEAEERRRVWAGLTMLHTIQNTCLGNLAPFRIEAGVRMPADVDDEVLGTSSAVYESVKPTKMSYILFKFRLYHLAFDICRLSSSSSSNGPEWSRLRHLDETIYAEQQAHARRFHLAELPVYHVAHKYILSNYTNHLVLLLHRPYLGRGKININIDIHHNADTDTDYRYEHSVTRCKDAALAILSTYEVLHSNDAFRPYAWYIRGLGSFHAFLAVTTLLVLSTRNRTSQMDMAIRGCVRRFREMSERSEICAKASEILAPLVDEERGLGLGDFVGIGPGDEETQFDLNGWTIPPQLGCLIEELPCEQWLSPAGFPWGV